MERPKNESNFIIYNQHLVDTYETWDLLKKFYQIDSIIIYSARNELCISHLLREYQPRKSVKDNRRVIQTTRIDGEKKKKKKYNDNYCASDDIG